MNALQEEELEQAVDIALSKAEAKWKGGGHVLQKSSTYNDSVKSYVQEQKESSIPGHPFVSDEGIVIDKFIAIVADMRDSSKHLQSVTSHKKADVSDIQRVFYETSALLPALSMTINFQGGAVTEYLGDGVLALFKVDQDNPNTAMYAARRAAQDIIRTTRNIVNSALNEKYRLTPIDVGVGMAASKAMVTLVGAEIDKQPKVFGECVFRATKLSIGRNVIYTDKILKQMWPTGKGGKVVFNHKKFGDLDGYRMTS